jgi:hypothetical protein
MSAVDASSTGATRRWGGRTRAARSLRVSGLALLFLTSLLLPGQLSATAPAPPGASERMGLVHSGATAYRADGALAAMANETPLGSAWPLSLTIATDTSEVCAYGSSECAAAPSSVRIHLTASPPGAPVNNSTAVQILFLLDDTPLTSDCGGPGDENGGCYSGATQAIQTFRASAGVIARALSLAHPHDALTFGEAGDQSANVAYDDNDSVPYEVPLGTFVNASQFGPAVNRSVEPGGDVDESDNPLQTSEIPALYGMFTGGPGRGSEVAFNSARGTANWTAGDDHVVVVITAGAPVDSNYTMYACPYESSLCPPGTGAGTMDACQPSWGALFSFPTCEGWTSSQNGVPLDSIAALSLNGTYCLNSSTGHCTVDSIVLNASSTDPASPVWTPLNGSGFNFSLVRADTDHIVDAGCNLSAATGGSWDGPLNSRCGLANGTLGYDANVSDPALVSALENISLGAPIPGPVATPPNDGPMFRFVLPSPFALAPVLDPVATCSTPGGRLSSCPQSPTIGAENGTTTLGWNWSATPGSGAMEAGDVWSAAFDVVADSGPSNATVLDVCEAAGCPASDASAPRGEVSGAEFYGWTLPQLFEESFPPVTVTIAGDAALSGSLVTPRTEVDVATPVAVTYAATGGYTPYTVTWDFGDGTWENSTGVAVDHAYASSGLFDVRAELRDQSGATIRSSVWVTVYDALSTTISAWNTSGSAPFLTIFDAATEGGLAPYTVQWSFGDGGAASGPSVEHVFQSPGAYVVRVEVSDSLGSTVSNVLPVSVSPAAVALVPPLSANATASLVSTDASCVTSSSVRYTGTASGGVAPYTFAWSFSDGQVAEGAVVMHTFASSHPGTATLRVSDSNGTTTQVDAPSILGGPVAGPSPCTVSPSGSRAAPVPVPILIAAGLGIVSLVTVAALLLRRRP